MNRMVLLAIVGMTIAALTGILQPTLAAVVCCWYEDAPTDSVRVSTDTAKKFGYVTHEPKTTRDLSFDSRGVVTWPVGTSSKSYFINMSNASLASGFTEASAVSTIQSAASSWRSLYSSITAPIPSVIGTQDNTVPASLNPTTGCGTGLKDNKNAVAWCSSAATGGAPAVTNRSPSMASSGAGVKTGTTSGNQGLVEVDIVYNKDYFINSGNWSQSYLDFYTRHEFGHFYGLGDLYQAYGGACDVDSGGDSDQIMCGLPSSQGWGDRAGASWMYPKRYSTSLSVTNTVSGSDSAVGSIPGSGTSSDLLIAYADYNSATPETTIKVKPIWDISSSGSGTAGTVVSLLTVSNQVYDIGATFANVNSGTTPDLIVSYSQNSAGLPIVKFRVFFDISYSGGAFTWSSSSPGATVSGAGGDKGTDVAVYNFDTDTAQELVVMDSYFDGTKNVLYWYWGDISTAGDVASWNIVGTDGGTISVGASEDIGFAKPSSVNDRIVTVYYRDNTTTPAPAESYMHEHLINISTSGTVGSNKILGKYAPLYSIGTITLEGIGGGDAVNLGGTSLFKDEIISWVDGTTAYYTIEWEGRLNSHP